jgi:hypothetical protein
MKNYFIKIGLLLCFFTAVFGMQGYEENSSQLRCRGQLKKVCTWVSGQYFCLPTEDTYSTCIDLD